METSQRSSSASAANSSGANTTDQLTAGEGQEGSIAGSWPGGRVLKPGRLCNDADLDVVIRCSEDSSTKRLEIRGDILSNSSRVLKQKINTIEVVRSSDGEVKRELDLTVESLRTAKALGSMISATHQVPLLDDYQTFVDFGKTMYDYGWRIEDFEQSASVFRNLHWNDDQNSDLKIKNSNPTIPNIEHFESWTLLAFVFNWSNVFVEASRNVIMKTVRSIDEPWETHSSLPEELRVAVSKRRTEVEDEIRRFADNIFDGSDMEHTLQKRCRRVRQEFNDAMREEGFGPYTPWSGSPAEILQSLVKCAAKVLNPSISLSSPQVSHSESDKGITAQPILQSIPPGGRGSGGGLWVEQKLSGGGVWVGQRIQQFRAHQSKNQLHHKFSAGVNNLKKRLTGLELSEYTELRENKLIT